MNSLHPDSVSKHRISKTNPSALSRIAEIMRAMAKDGMTLDSLDLRVHEVYVGRYGKCRLAQVTEHTQLLRELELLSRDETPILDPAFAEGCYDETFSQTSKAILVDRFYLHSKIFRDLLTSLSRGNEVQAQLLLRLDSVHGLNKTARDHVRRWARALGVSDEWLGRAIVARWLQERKVSTITSRMLRATLEDLRREYGAQYYLGLETFNNELFHRVFLGQVDQKLLSALVVVLDKLKVVSTQIGKENKTFIYISSPENLAREEPLNRLLLTEWT